MTCGYEQKYFTILMQVVMNHYIRNVTAKRTESQMVWSFMVSAVP
jgi:hypothetical protein